MFEYALLPKETLEQVTTPKGRYYIDKDGGKYISVTTVIDKNSDKTSLNEWKARVGEKEAAKVSPSSNWTTTSVLSISISSCFLSSFS